MNARVPDRATVPRLSISSCRSMPIPVSVMVSVSASASGLIRIARAPASPQQFRFRNRLVAKLVAGIGRIGDQLAQKHVGLGIDRVHHEAQQFGNLRLERVGFGNGFGPRRS